MINLLVSNIVFGNLMFKLSSEALSHAASPQQDNVLPYIVKTAQGQIRMLNTNLKSLNLMLIK